LRSVLTERLVYRGDPGKSRQLFGEPAAERRGTVAACMPTVKLGQVVARGSGSAALLRAPMASLRRAAWRGVRFDPIPDMPL
jgi:hypothetical protein